MTAKMWEHLEAIAKAEDADAAWRGGPPEGFTAAEIGNALGVTTPTAGKAARALQDEGYVYDIVTHGEHTRYRVSGRGKRALTEHLASAERPVDATEEAQSPHHTGE
jgi:DNA-binding MarR family transcriptional regulator